MRLIVVFFGGGLLVLVLLVLDLSRPAPAPSPAPEAAQPRIAVAPAPAAEPLQTVADAQPAAPTAPPQPPPKQAITRVAIPPPPLPQPEVVAAAPVAPVEPPATRPPPPRGRVVWADEVRARLSRAQLRDLRQAATQLPDDSTIEARGNLADRFARAGQGDAQLALLAAGVRADPESIRPRVEYAAALMRSGLWSQAADEWRSVVTRDAMNPYAWHNLALALQESGAVEDALQAWGQALHIAPDNIDGIAQRGQLHLHREDWTAALADFEAVLRAEPQATDALLNGALAAERLGQFTRARGWAWQVAGDGSQHPQVVATAVERLLQIALASGTPDRAAEQLGYQLLNNETPAEQLRDLLDLTRERG